MLSVSSRPQAGRRRADLHCLPVVLGPVQPGLPPAAQQELEQGAQAAQDSLHRAAQRHRYARHTHNGE